MFYLVRGIHRLKFIERGSMHTGELLKSRKTVLIVVVGLLVAAVYVFAPLGTLGAQQPSSGSSEKPPVPVSVIKAERQDAIHESEVVGTVESLQHVTVRAQIDGILTDIYFTEGQLVEKGQLLAAIDDRAPAAALAAAEAQLERDKALLKAAELDLERYASLLPSGAVSKQVSDQQVAKTDELRATIRLDEAHVETARVNLSYTKIHSPVTGRIGMRLVDAGNMVRANDAQGIVSVVQVNPVSIVFPVSQRLMKDLQQAMSGDKGSLAEALDPQTRNVLATGKIVALDNIIDQATGTKRVRAIFDNDKEHLSPGEFVAVRIRTGLSRDVIVLPAATVRLGLEGHYVYRVKSDNTAERVAVKTGYANDNIIVVNEGIESGDTIVSGGHARLNNGAKVVVQSGVPGDAPQDDVAVQ